MATWADFYPELMPHVLGCPDPTANVALREAAREFFESTRIWCQWLDPITVAAGVRTYDLDIPTGAMVVRIERSTINGEPLDVLSTAGLERDPATQVTENQGMASQDRASFVLTRAVPAGALVAARVSLMPTKTAIGLPDDLFQYHGQDIVEGAKQRLLMIKKTDFYAPDLAMAAGAVFNNAIARKTVVAWQGATGKVPRRRPTWC